MVIFTVMGKLKKCVVVVEHEIALSSCLIILKGKDAILEPSSAACAPKKSLRTIKTRSSDICLRNLPFGGEVFQQKAHSLLGGDELGASSGWLTQFTK